MKWLIFYFTFFCAYLWAESVTEKQCLNVGPPPRNKEEILNLSSSDLVKINLSDDVYLDTDPEIPAKWISSEGEQYGFPFAMELAKTFKIQALPFKVDFLGYFNQYVGIPGREYAWRAQIQLFLPE